MLSCSFNWNCDVFKCSKNLPMLLMPFPWLFYFQTAIFRFKTINKNIYLKIFEVEIHTLLLPTNGAFMKSYYLDKDNSVIYQYSYFIVPFTNFLKHFIFIISPFPIERHRATILIAGSFSDKNRKNATSIIK